MVTLTCVPFVFTIGVYEGVGKTRDFNLVYRKFVEEVLLLQRKGFEWRGVHRKVKLCRLTFDVPARASSLFIKLDCGYHVWEI
jgi:hypothetical protein